MESMHDSTNVRRDDLDNARSISEYLDNVQAKATAETTAETTVKVTFNVASLDNAGNAIDSAERYSVINDLYGFLADRFGGASSYDGFGAWRDDNGNVVREANTFVYSFAPAADIVPEVLEGKARLIARRLSQDAVMVSLEPVISVSFVSSK